jgi:hypothetical protein
MKEQLIEALKRLARGHVDAAEQVAELLMPEPETFAVDVEPFIPSRAEMDKAALDAVIGSPISAPKKKAK